MNEFCIINLNVMYICETFSLSLCVLSEEFLYVKEIDEIKKKRKKGHYSEKAHVLCCLSLSTT